MHNIPLTRGPLVLDRSPEDRMILLYENKANDPWEVDNIGPGITF